MINGFTIFGLKIYFYGIIIMTGVVLATLLSARRAKAKGLNPDFIWDIVTWVVIGGIIGARIWHILTPSPALVERGITTQYYLTNPLAMLDIRNGGLGILGAVVGGGLTLFFLLRRRKEPFGRWADVIAPGLILAQAIGRWGNFVNQELYGGPSNLPWAIYIDPQHRYPEFANVEYYHPTFLYESLLNLAVMGFLLWADKRWKNCLKEGDLFLFYTTLYPLVRFGLEFLRLDSSELFGINANQWIMLVIALGSMGLLIYRHRDRLFGGKKAAETTDEPVS